MNGTILVVRDGNSLMILPEEGDKLPSTVLAAFERTLSYNYKTCDWRGKLQLTKKYLYSISDVNNIVSTTIGMSSKVVNLLRSMGFPVKFKDTTTKDRNPLLIRPNWDLLTTFNFRAQQKECLTSITKSPGGVIVAPTGFGKTFLIGALGRLYPTAKIHVCTKSVEIARRIYTDLLKLLPSVGMVGGGTRQTEARITVVTADSLAHVSGDCDFFFFDECHQAAAETYTAAILDIYKNARRYGFTATPDGRSDGADPLLEALFGEQIFTLNYQQGVALGLVVPIRVRWLPCDCSIHAAYNSWQTSMQRKRDNIWTNSCRNHLIAEDIQEQSKDDSILVLVETIEHALQLWKELPDFQVCYSNMLDEDLNMYKQQGLLPSNYIPLSKKDRMQLCKDFAAGKVKRVISTDVWSTGVDFPSLSSVYSVSGRVSKILTTQGAGRVSRLFKGKLFGNVIDIQDRFSPEFAAYAKKRFTTYEKLGWSQKGFVE